MKKKSNNPRNKSKVNSGIKVNRIVLFYLGLLPDNKDRYIEDIWKYSNMKLEIKHDYIQWLFPTNEKSQHNSSAPVLTEYDIKMVRSNKKIKSNMIKSLQIILKFYGFELTETSKNISVEYGEYFTKRSTFWCAKNNHNHLRITRILKSLNLFGLHEYAEAFYKALIPIYKETGVISKDTFKCWHNATYPK